MSGPQPPFRSVQAQAAALAAAGQAEAQAFDVVGRWVRSVPEAEFKVLLAVQARHHGQHAADLDAACPRVPAAAPVPAAFPADLLDALAALTTTPARLVALATVVLPGLVALTAPAPCPRLEEAPVARVLHGVDRDHAAHAATLEAALARLAPASSTAPAAGELAALAALVGQDLRQELRRPASNHPTGPEPLR